MKGSLLIPLALVLLLTCVPGGSAASAANTSAGLFRIYPDDYIWNVPVAALPADPRSAEYVHSGNPDAYLYLFSAFPYNVVNSTQPRQRLTFFEYPEYCDDIPYPIPDNPLIENNSDQHLLILDTEGNWLYEMYHARKNPDGTWRAGVAVAYNLSDYTLRPDHTVSADAAGLPILPGVIRYEEVESGEIRHALRFSAYSLRNTYIWPARAGAGSDDSNPSLPPHGQRFRLNASFNTSGYGWQEEVILTALKRYGMILADYNGGDPSIFSIYAAPDDRWTIEYTTFRNITLADFEAVDESSLMISSTSGQVRTESPTPVAGSNLVILLAVPAAAALIIAAIALVFTKRRAG